MPGPDEEFENWLTRYLSEGLPGEPHPDPQDEFQTEEEWDAFWRESILASRGNFRYGSDKSSPSSGTPPEQPK